jgi:hypothetical protein
MKTLTALLICASALAGCAVVPYEPAPVVYAAPPPAVVVVPRPHYVYRGYGYRRWR